MKAELNGNTLTLTPENGFERDWVIGRCLNGTYWREVTAGVGEDITLQLFFKGWFSDVKRDEENAD